LSHSEASRFLSCQAAWDFSYNGTLAGTALKSKNVRVILRQGRAWGAGVAALHHSGRLELATLVALWSLEEDAEQQREFGFFDAEEHEKISRETVGMLQHYADSADPLDLEFLEHEIHVPIPSRTGKRSSNRYKLQLFLDGTVKDEDGKLWIVEFKLRGQLSSFEQIMLSRQLRWYAWGYREKYGVTPAGVIVDERLNVLPKPVKLNQNGEVSKTQSCTPAEYVAACAKAEITKKKGEEPTIGMEPDAEVLQKLEDKKWQKRERLILRPDEIDEAGKQLVSFAQQINGMENGDVYPVRNSTPYNCGGCAFKEICADPSDTAVVDALFERVQAKHEREEVA